MRHTFVLLAFGFLISFCVAGAEGESMEVLKTDFQTHSLHCLDLDGDGDEDIILANRDSGSIDILKFGADTATEKSTEKSPDPNRLQYNSRWKLDSLPVDRDIYALKVVDLNGDGKPDLLFHGSPENLLILLQGAEASFGAPKEIEIPLGLCDSGSLLVGTLPGSGGTEIAVQHADRRTHILLGGDGSLIDKVEIPIPRSSIGKFRSMHWGSPREGLEGLWVQQEDPVAPLLFYRHLEKLRYDYPERIRLPQTRFLVSGRFQEGGRDSFIQVRTQQGQLSAVSFEVDAPTVERSFPLAPRTIPYTHTGSREFSFLLHDVDRDGLEDLLIAHRESAQLELFLRRGPSFLPGSTSPSYKEADFLLPDPAGVLVASKQEGVIGLASWDGERLQFPRALPSVGEVLCFLMAHDTPPGFAQIIAVEGKPVLALGEERLPLQIEEPYPQRGKVVHLRGGSRPELILEIPYRGLRIFGWDSEADSYVDLVKKLSFLKEQELSELTLGALELLPYGKAFDLSLSGPRMIRRYRFVGEPQVVEQVNLPDPASTSSFHASMDLDQDSLPELISYDGPAGKLDIFTRKGADQPYQWVRSQSAPGIRGLGLFSADAGKGKGRDILLAGQGEMELFRTETAGLISASTKAIPFCDEEWAFSAEGSALARSPGGQDTLFLLDNRQNYMEMLSCKGGIWQRDCFFPVFVTGSFQQDHTLGGVNPAAHVLFRRKRRQG
ncbi:MAG: VCBS repeat-containing protein, partial [Planctomycetes bacterium]|nr:VCBS repeat-containing protein [Planctomycetota bacterium]